MAVVAALLPLLFGCREPGCGAPCEGLGDDGKTAPPPYTAEEPEAEWTAEDVGQTITEVFGGGFPNGVLMRDTYMAIMAESDPTLCPVFASEYTGDYPDDITEENILGCTATSGYYYSGVCMYDELETTDDAGYTLIWGLGGDFLLAYPDGSEFAAGGGVTYTGVRATDGTETFDSTTRGTWYDESLQNWLGQGFSGLFSTTGGLDADGHWVTVHGGVAVGSADLFFDEVTWTWSDTCDGQPSGVINLRDERGYWYAWTLPDDCSGCGNVVFHDSDDLGELCLDLAALGVDIYDSAAVP